MVRSQLARVSDVLLYMNGFVLNVWRQLSTGLLSESVLTEQWCVNLPVPCLLSYCCWWELTKNLTRWRSKRLHLTIRYAITNYPRICSLEALVTYLHFWGMYYRSSYNNHHIFIFIIYLCIVKLQLWKETPCRGFNKNQSSVCKLEVCFDVLYMFDDWRFNYGSLCVLKWK
jgi:hypothetical protein